VGVQALGAAGHIHAPARPVLYAIAQTLPTTSLTIHAVAAGQTSSGTAFDCDSVCRERSISRRQGRHFLSLIVIIVVLLLLFGGGGGYYGYRRYGGSGLGGVLGLVLIILLALWFLGGLHFQR
jgi:hypothetical protein